MFGVFAIIVTSVFSGCSDFSVQTDCLAGTGCVWSPGSCSIFNQSDCNLNSCATGCDVTLPAAAKCAKPAVCAGGTSEETCVALSDKCAWSSNSCRNKTTPPVCTIDGDGNCPTSAGCVEEYKPVCEKSGGGGGGSSSCGDYSTAEVTECAYYGSFCKVVGSNCVAGGDVEEEEVEDVNYFCALASTTRKASACFDTDGICKVTGSSCAVRPELSDEEDFEEWAVACATLPTSALSPCASHSGCKVAAGTCQDKTEDELCQSNGVTGRYSPCKVNSSGCCDVAGTVCVNAEKRSDWCTSVCSELSVELSISECAYRGSSDCIITGGQCRADTFVCKLDAFGVDCDAESKSHQCYFNHQKTCRNFDCGTSSYELCPTPGCEQSNTGVCSSTHSCSIDFGPDSTGCLDSSDSECDDTPPVSARCEVATAPTATACAAKDISEECYTETGCKWLLSVGGKCDVAKNPDNNTNNNPDNHAVSIFSVPLFLLIVLFLVL